MKTFIFIVLALIAYTSAHVCRSEGDPHYRAFNGRTFDFYHTGEFILFHKGDYQCNSRLRQSNRHWIGRSLNAGVACQVRGVHFELDVVNDTDNVAAFLNNQANFRGQKTVNGVDVMFNGNAFHFKYNKMEMTGNIQNIPGPYPATLKKYFNVYVYSHDINGATGLCSGQTTKATKTLFFHGKAPLFREGVKRTISAAELKWAEGICGKHFQHGSYSYKACVTDLAETKDQRVVGDMEKISQMIHQDFKKECHKGVCHYYKKVTQTHTIRTAHDHYTWHTEVDHQARTVAKQNADKIRAQIANLNKLRNQQIQNTQVSASKQITNFQNHITNANKHYQNTVAHWNNWRTTQHKNFNAEYTKAVNDINKWAATIRSQADTHHKNTVTHWTKWRADIITHANKHHAGVVNQWNTWRVNTINQANAHHAAEVKKWDSWRAGIVKHANDHRATIVKNITNWRNQRIAQLQKEIAAAHLHYQNTINNINKWHADRIKYANDHRNANINNINKWRADRITYANNHRNNQINAVNKWRTDRHTYAHNTYNNEIKKINAWRVQRHQYADNHRNSVITAKRNWLNQRNAWANAQRDTNIKNITNWRTAQINAHNANINKVHQWRTTTINNINKSFNAQLAAFQKQLQHWETVSKTATKRVQKKHTTYTNKTITTHDWVKIAHK